MHYRCLRAKERENAWSQKLVSDFTTFLFFFPLSSGVLNVWGARMAQWVRSLDLTTHASLSPIRRGLAPGFVNYKKRCTRLAAASDKVYQLLAHGRWFSLASSTTKTGRHDITEILLKVALKHQKCQNMFQSFWERRTYYSVRTENVLFGVLSQHFSLTKSDMKTQQYVVRH
jgi:hypothetical protein